MDSSDMTAWRDPPVAAKRIVELGWLTHGTLVFHRGGASPSVPSSDNRAAADAERIYKVSYQCEPPPDPDSVAVANMLIRSIPSVADVTDPAEEKKLVGLAYRLSRALIGNRLATAFEFPKKSPWEVATLLQYRTKQRVLRRLAGSRRIRAHNFTQLLQISVYDDEGLSYRMPDHVHTAKSINW